MRIRLGFAATLALAVVGLGVDWRIGCAVRRVD